MKKNYSNKKRAATSMQTMALSIFMAFSMAVVPLKAVAEDVPVADSVAKKIYLNMGSQQTVIPKKTPSRIAVGNPDILQVKILRNKEKSKSSEAELLLTPKATGVTSLILWPEKSGDPEYFSVQVVGQQLVLDRKLSSMQEHAHALAAMRASMPEKTFLADSSQIEVRSNTVQVDVQVVELKKSALKQVGINFGSRGSNDKGFNFGVYNPGTSAGGNPFADAMNLVLGFGKAFSGAGLDVNLSLLEGNGLARVLARPTLVAHSGQSASFLAGGELPIPVAARDGNISIEYKEFGVKLQLTPTVLANDRIALKVAPESSDLDFANAVAISGVFVPAIRTRRADTMVELADGESFVIGGLVSRSTTSNVDKVPLLGDLPILGSFFKNMSYSQEETELVIVVTPTLVHPLPAGTQLEAHMPGAAAERPNASGVWGAFLAGGGNANGRLPGFSH